MEYNLWTMPEVYVVLLIVVLLCACFYSLGWQRGNKAIPIFDEEVIEPEETSVEVLVPIVEMVSVLEPTTGPLDVLLPLNYYSIPALKSQIHDLSDELAKAERAKTRHWKTIQRLKQAST